MSLILSIETSTNACSIALHKAGNMVAEETLYVEKSHAQSLMPMIDHVFTLVPYKKQELCAVALSVGPGSYTGLRIGASVAKGLGEVLGIPLLAINTLEAMAKSVRNHITHNAFFCPMLDARRMEVYYTLLDTSGNILEPSQPHIFTDKSFVERLKQGLVYFFGDGVEKCWPQLAQYPNARHLPGILPSARCVGELAWIKWEHNEAIEPEQLSLEYLKAVHITKSSVS